MKADNRTTEQAALDFQNSSGLPRSAAPQNLKFEREDWTSFRTVEGLQQKAGVVQDKLRRLVLKEITDNSLDTGAIVSVGTLSGGGYFIEDDGPGIDGAPEEIARLFSIARPMISTKLLRLPTRGALGNGLRVAAGAVLASDGSLIVMTRNRRIKLRPERDGSTTIISAKPVKFPKGTRVEITFGAAIPDDLGALEWAEAAIMLAVTGKTYAGKSSPWWYDLPQFHELLSASGNRLVRDLIANLDGCTGGRAGEIVAEAGLSRTICGDVSREQAANLLKAARENARPVNPKRLGMVGPEAFPNSAYAAACGAIAFGAAEPLAEIPFIVEAWATENTLASDMRLTVFVNRTPVAGEIFATRDKRDIDIYGCGLANAVAQMPKDKNFIIRLNITTPYMPITSDGKEPDLDPFLDQIQVAVQKVVRKAHRPNAGNGKGQKEIVLENLDAAIAKAGGGYIFAQRQVHYVLRPVVMEATGEELKRGHFAAIITEYENEHGPIPRMYREPRGSIYHPHRKETLTLGDLMVENYKRPLWTFNKLLYIEKEGFTEALKEIRWGERHDCAVMSSKGFSTRAARDLIDKLAEHGEPVEMFCCVHDADGYGGVIYQTLQEATDARDARKIRIINLGLEPWEALAIGLEVETVKPDEKRKPVADYIRKRRDLSPTGETWEEWLQANRVELNAMTTPQFIVWLDAKMAAHASGKLIPPAEVLDAELAKRIEDKVRAAHTERILREAELDSQVAATIAAIKLPNAMTLASGTKKLFKQDLSREWRDHIEAVAKRLTKRVRSP